MNFFIYIFSLILVFFLSACSKEGCTNSKSSNYNSSVKKDDRSCTYWRDNFIGSYLLQDTCSYPDGSTYSLMITPLDNNYDSVIISDGSINYIGEIISDKLITIPMQIGEYSGIGYAMNGSISFEDYNLNMNYVFTMNGDTRICNATGIRQ